MQSGNKRRRVSLIARFWGGEEDWTRLKRLFLLVIEYKALIVVALVCMVIYNLLNALPAWSAEFKAISKSL